MREVKFFKAKPSPDRHGKTGRAERGELALRAWLVRRCAAKN